MLTYTKYEKGGGKEGEAKGEAKDEAKGEEGLMERRKKVE